jgi:REP element-mobilizing transposase RayT
MMACGLVTYLITFTCYGSHLHGDENGSVDRLHSQPRTPFVDPLPTWQSADRFKMKQPPFALSESARPIVLDAIIDVCRHRGWRLFAAHVRSTHIHVVVSGDARPERMMCDFKLYASRVLNRLAPDAVPRTYWTRHGSTRWINTPAGLQAAVHYVVEAQGPPMALYYESDGRAADVPPLTHVRGS